MTTTASRSPSPRVEAPRRPSRPWRLAAVLATLVIGCVPGAAAPRRPAEASEVEARPLEPPEDRPAAVRALAWGGPSRSRRLGVLLGDDRFAVYRPGSGLSPTSVGRAEAGRGGRRALAIVDGDRLVTGDDRGLTLWATGSAEAAAIERLDCGAVGALAVLPVGPGDLLVGLRDGRLLRFRPDRRSLGPAVAESRSSGRASGVRGIDVVDGGRSIVVLRDDGRAERRSRTLAGPATLLGPSVAAAGGGPAMARLVAPADGGPAVVVDGDGRDGSGWRFPLPSVGRGLASVRGGDGLVAACDGRVLLLRSVVGTAPRAAEARQLVVPAGPTVVAADPVDPNGRRLALGDASGRVVVIDAEALAATAGPLPLLDAASMAFRPWQRAHRPGEGDGRGPAETAGGRLAGRIEAARRRVDLREFDGLLIGLTDLDADPGLDRLGAADVALLIAACGQEAGWSTPGLLRPLDRARSTFALHKRRDRESDVLLWSGLLRVPPLDGRPAAVDATDVEVALDAFREAAAAAREARGPDDRRARVADAMVAWSLLALGRTREAERVFEAAEVAAAADPVLGQSPECDRIAAALAVARRDWEAADLAGHRLLIHLGPPAMADPALVREATLERLGTLAALGRWSEAAALVEDDRPADPEWTLRRATVRRCAGLPDDPEPAEPPPLDTPEGAGLAHVRARRLAAGSPEDREEAEPLLRSVAEAHREAGRSDLAAEATLERAELLERQNRPGEALALFARVARTLGAETPRERTRGAARPIGDALGRADRGIIRGQLRLGRPGAALAAIERASLVAWFDREGEDRVRSSSLAGPLLGPSAEGLIRARRDADGADPGGTEFDRLREAEGRHAAGHRALAPIDPARWPLGEAPDPGPGEAILVYAAAGPGTILGTLLRDDRPPSVRVLPAPRGLLREAARRWRAGLGDGGRPCELEPPRSPVVLLSIAPEPDLQPAGRVDPGGEPSRLLREALLVPFLADLGGVDRLTVVPDDAVAALPIEAIAEPGDALPPVRYAPSLAVLRRAREASSPSRSIGGGRPVRMAAAGDPVALLAIRSSYADSSRTVAVVTEPSALFADEQTAAVLHLGAAAILDPASSRSGEPELIGGPAESAGGERLASGDLLGLNLDGAVVVLAIRHRPLPAVADPASWRDLARDALAAGAGAVVVSLWDPPADSGPVLAATLHEGLAAGLTPAEALDRARRSVAAEPRFADPVHWAGFVVYDPRLEPR